MTLYMIFYWDKIPYHKMHSFKVNSVFVLVFSVLQPSPLTLEHFYLSKKKSGTR